MRALQVVGYLMMEAPRLRALRLGALLVEAPGLRALRLVLLRLDQVDMIDQGVQEVNVSLGNVVVPVFRQQLQVPS